MEAALINSVIAPVCCLVKWLVGISPETQVPTNKHVITLKGASPMLEVYRKLFAGNIKLCLGFHLQCWVRMCVREWHQPSGILC